MAEPVQDSAAFVQVLRLLDDRPVTGFNAAVESAGEWIVTDAGGVIARGRELESVLAEVASHDPDTLAVGFIGPPDLPGTAGGGGGRGLPIDPLREIREVGVEWFTNAVHATADR